MNLVNCVIAMEYTRLEKSQQGLHPPQHSFFNIVVSEYYDGS